METSKVVSDGPVEVEMIELFRMWPVSASSTNSDGAPAFADWLCAKGGMDIK